MRILVDTSVWSLALRRGGPAEHPAVSKLHRYLDTGEDLFLTVLILQEILQAFRSEKVASQIADYFEPGDCTRKRQMSVSLSRFSHVPAFSVSNATSHAEAKRIG